MRNIRKECKCHGLSASCTIKHCWERIPPFREVGELLLVEYGGATLIKIDNNTASGLIPVEERQLSNQLPESRLHRTLGKPEMAVGRVDPRIGSCRVRLGRLKLY